MVSTVDFALECSRFESEFSHLGSITFLPTGHVGLGRKGCVNEHLFELERLWSNCWPLFG
jgi:hypothetical protein